MYAWADEVSSTRKEETKDGLKQVRTNKLLKFIGMEFEALHDSRDTKRALFNNFLIARAKHIEEDGHDVFNHGERILGYVPTTICGCSHCGSLSARGEELKICQAGSQSSFPDNCCWIFDRNFLECLSRLLAVVTSS